MHELKIFTVTAWADEDMELGDAVYFTYLNGEDVDPPGVHATKPLVGGSSTRTIHGAVIEGGLAGELITVKVAIEGTISIKTTWTGDLHPGAGIYPPDTTAGMAGTTGPEQNLLGVYVGKDVIPVTDSGSRIEVLILRVAPQILPV